METKIKNDDQEQTIIKMWKICKVRIKKGEKNKATRHVIDYEKPLFIRSPSGKTRETRKWPRAWLKTRDGWRSRLCTPLTKSEEKESLLTV